MNKLYTQLIIETQTVEFFKDGERHQVHLDDTNHFFNVKPSRFIDFPIEEIILKDRTVSTTIYDRIEPSGKKMVYISKVGPTVYWENYEDYEARQRVLSKVDKIIGYERGYIAGTTHPSDAVKGITSAGKFSGYEFWQKIYKPSNL
jgi:hypothetical protein